MEKKMQEDAKKQKEDQER